MTEASDSAGRGVGEQLHALLANAIFAEHSRVRVVRDFEAEGYYLSRGMTGTVVAIYGQGAAYAVEFANLGEGIDVVTVSASDLAEATA